MRPNPVCERLRDGGHAYGVMATEFFTPGFCQIAAGCGAEFVIFDQEHGAVGIDTLKAQIAFARGVGIAPFVTGIGNADAILAMPGIDVGWLGHYDLTNTMGITAEFKHPDFHAAVDTLLAACRRHGKAPGILAGTVETAREWRARGFRALCCGADVSVFQSALGGIIGALKGDG